MSIFINIDIYFLALYLFEKKIVTLSQAVKIAELSIDEFLDILKETDIDVEEEKLPLKKK
jgi:predicted HTH domain antitoxin